MSVLIDADEVMERLRSNLEADRIVYVSADYIEREVIAPMKRMGKADRPQGWIPCGERLPRAEEKVWIQTERGKVCFAMYEDGTISEDDSAWHWYDLPFDKWDEENDCGIIPEGWWEWTEFHPDNEFDCPVDEVVVAWMPLPEPWKGADDEID